MAGFENLELCQLSLWGQAFTVNAEGKQLLTEANLDACLAKNQEPRTGAIVAFMDTLWRAQERAAAHAPQLVQFLEKLENLH